MVEMVAEAAESAAFDIERAQIALLSGSTKLRVKFLRSFKEKLSRSELELEPVLTTIQVLFSTHSRYQDSLSRLSVQECFKSALCNSRYSSRTALLLSQYLLNQSETRSISSVDSYVLLCWASLLLYHLIHVEDGAGPVLSSTIIATARSLGDCLSDARTGMQASAQRVALRSLRSGLRNDNGGELFLTKLLDALITGPGADAANIPYLGAIARACARNPDRVSGFQSRARDVLTFYSKAVVGSKQPVPQHVAGGLAELFSSSTSLKEVVELVFTPLEKAILRSPEIVLRGLIPSFVDSLPFDFDLAEVLDSKLLIPLLTSLSSTNQAIKTGAVHAAVALIGRSQSDEALQHVAATISSSLFSSRIFASGGASSKAPSHEMRSLLAQLLLALPASAQVSAEVVPSLAKAASQKTVADTPLESEIAALSHHVRFLVHAGSIIDSSALKTVSAGWRDKLPAQRKIWHIQTGEIFWPLNGKLPKDGPTAAFMKSFFEETSKTFLEACASPVASLQNGVIPAAFVLVAFVGSKRWTSDIIPSVKPDQIVRQALALSPKPSFLLNNRIITRLTSKEEWRWAIRALTSISDYLESESREVRSRWAQCLIYLATAIDVLPLSRRYAQLALSTEYFEHTSMVGESILFGIQDWRNDLLANNKDSIALLSRVGHDRLYPVLECINPTRSAWKDRGHDFPEEIVKHQLLKSLVFYRPELYPRSNWIDSCLRTGIDPGKLVEAQPDSFVDQVLVSCDRADTTNDQKLYEAACKAAADLAFVAPSVILPRLVHQIEEALSPNQLKDLSALHAAIARSPEGVAFVDVLNQKATTETQRHLNNYDILRWEEDVKAQLAQKKGEAKKLTAEQKAKVEAQVAREAEIRKKVGLVQSNIRRGATLIQALAEGPPSDSLAWLTPSTKSILIALEAGAALFTHDELATAYLSCSSKISDRLGTLGAFVGVATLRATASSRLSKDYEAEPLGQLVTRVLFRLRFAAEQLPFDHVTFAYVIPLIFTVLQKGSIGYPSGEEADAQVLLAIEFLGFHASICSEVRLARSDIFQNIIHALEVYPQHYRLLKDVLVEICRSVSGNIGSTEIQTLLQGVTSSQASVRSAVLQAIQAHIDLTDLNSSKELWLACHDAEDEIAELAHDIWEENELSEEESLVFDMVEYLGNQNANLRRSAARGLAAAITFNENLFAPALQRLQEDYRTAAQPLVPKRDKFGIVQRGELKDPWEKRSGIAASFQEMAALFPKAALLPFFQFLIQDGPLGDRNSIVRAGMLDAGTTLISSRGKECLEPFMNLCKSSLEAPDNGSKESDWINEAVVVLYGSVARHLSSKDKRVQTVISQLVIALSTPSEDVQWAVSNCLPPLVRLIDEKVSSYLDDLLKHLLDEKHYAAKRGAAYGLAGFVKGRGIASLRHHRIMSTLKAASEDKKKVEHRQGALVAYEVLSLLLGRLFEPYVIEILPQLLLNYGDSNSTVRDACSDAAKTCFSSLSSFGVKEVLPRLLEGLDDSHWRSKKAACNLLGAMAYLDSQQLASSLPEIIPPLTAVLNDSHKEVRLEANRSLQRFGEVITNPEVKSLVSVLLKALSDPVKYTEEALDGLIKVSFVHYLDAPSLALVVRILERGLADRSSTKRKSAQIIGSLAHLTERKDLISHLPILVTGLRMASVDPVPATRATASKGLGSLVEKLGEDALPDLIPSLMSSLKVDTGAGDRLGSAQALSEVLAGLGTTRLEETLPAILQNVSSTKPTVREGFMTLFIFLPACFGNSFANYLSQIIPSILGGLADELEAIRDTALRAGRLLVKNFSSKAIDLLLPELQRGLADDNYRIRLSSVELVGDLLFNISGISGKQEDDDDQNDGAAQAGQSLLSVLGQEKRDKVLSSLYICRCDTSGLVRTAAIAVWKALVATPRTLRELVPVLTQIIIARLASPNPESRLIAGNALGDVIRKAGEGVLATLLPALEEGLQNSTDADTRQGICTALREIIISASPDSVHDYETMLVSILRTSLVDANAEVRETAAEAFDSFQQVVGKKAVDHVLPYLLHLLQDSEEASHALSGLLTLLTDTGRANMILPTLLQTLLTPPITAFNAGALASLAKVGGSSMNRRLPAILNNLADGISSPKTSTDLREDLATGFDTILCSVDEHDGLNTAMSVMLAMIKHDDHHRRANAATRLANFFSKTSVDFSHYHQDLIRVLLISFDDRDAEVVKAAWTALSGLVSRLRKEDMEALAVSTRQALHQVGVKGSNLRGFLLPKGILPVLQIFLQGLINGSVDQRVQSALAISDIIDKTSPESLKPFVTQITGPLIRVVSERSIEVKCAILETLNQLLGKIPLFVKPFLPQLQRTFTKSLADPSSEVLRAQATKALSTLITLTPRVDPLIAELLTGSKNADAGVRRTMLKALQEVVTRVGSNMTDASKDSILGLIDSNNDLQDDSAAVTHALLLGGLIRVLSATNGAMLIKTRVLIPTPTRLSILALNAVLLESAGSLAPGFSSETVQTITAAVDNKNLFVQQNGVLAAGKYLLSPHTNPDRSDTGTLFQALIQPLSQADVDARRLALVVIRTVARSHPPQAWRHLDSLIPSVFANVRHPVIPVKLAAEAAFVQLFDVVDQDDAVFEEFIKGKAGKAMKEADRKSLGDYFRRVGSRLGAQARERREAEGGQQGLGLSADEKEDEKEVWSVGRVVAEAAGLFDR